MTKRELQNLLNSCDGEYSDDAEIIIAVGDDPVPGLIYNAHSVSGQIRKALKEGDLKKVLDENPDAKCDVLMSSVGAPIQEMK